MGAPSRGSPDTCDERGGALDTLLERPCIPGAQSDVVAVDVEFVSRDEPAERLSVHGQVQLLEGGDL
jgi:hypothetical protein